jgi:RNA polymerase sigma-70 factor (ECF subfamily)
MVPAVGRLTQDFFAYILGHDLIARSDPARGRFRAFLRTVCVRHLADQREREDAARRGGEGPHAKCLSRSPKA